MCPCLLEILIVTHAIHELTQLLEACFKWTKIRGDDIEDFMLEPHFRGEDGEPGFGNRDVILVREEPLNNEGTFGESIVWGRIRL